MMEGDAWMISMTQAEQILLEHINRGRVFSILKTLRDRHLNFAGSSVTNYLIKNLVLYECEKHYSDNEWHDFCIGDRLIGFNKKIFLGSRRIGINISRIFQCTNSDYKFHDLNPLDHDLKPLGTLPY